MVSSGRKKTIDRLIQRSLVKHKPRNSFKQDSKTEFMELNDYCIDEICEWLPLSSLASLGSTCKRLNQIASSYFRRRHPANYLVLSSSDGKIHFSPNQPYVHCFSDEFQTFVIYGADLKLFEFAANKFKEKRLKKISLFGAENLTENHAQKIDEILRKAEFIELIRCSMVGSLHEILKCCSNMKTLVLKSFNECKEHGQINDWLLRKYANLEHLHWCSLQEPPPELSVFFEQNPTVKSIYATEKLLPFIRLNGIKLDNLVLKTSYIQIDMFKQLKQMANDQAFRTMYLIGSLEYLDHIYPTMNMIEGVYSKWANVSTIATLFPNLKLLKTEVKSMAQAKDIAKQLIHLEEAYIDVNKIDYILPLVRFATKLKKIQIDNTISMKPGNQLSQINLDKQRNKLNSAPQLMIYLEEEAYLKIKCMSICSENCSVQFRSIESHVSDNVFVNTILDR